MGTTLKKHRCSICGKPVDNLSALKQSIHIKNCTPQQSLDIWDYDKSIIEEN